LNAVDHAWQRSSITLPNGLDSAPMAILSSQTRRSDCATWKYPAGICSRGNRRFADFLQQHGIPGDMPIRDKYRTRAAEWYRRELRAMAEGVPPPPQLPFGTGHLAMNDIECSAHEILDKVFVEAPCHDPAQAHGALQRHRDCAIADSPAKAVCVCLTRALGVITTAAHKHVKVTLHVETHAPLNGQCNREKTLSSLGEKQPQVRRKRSNSLNAKSAPGGSKMTE